MDVDIVVPERLLIALQSQLSQPRRNVHGVPRKAIGIAKRHYQDDVLQAFDPLSKPASAAGCGSDKTARSRTRAAAILKRRVDVDADHVAARQHLNQGPIRAYDEVVGQRPERPPAAVIDRADDADITADLAVPDRNDLNAEPGAAWADQLNHLRLSDQRLELVMRSRPIAIELLPEKPMGFVPVHGQPCWHGARRHAIVRLAEIIGG